MSAVQHKPERYGLIMDIMEMAPVALENISMQFHLHQYKQKHCSTWKVFGSRFGKITKYL